MTDTLFEWSSAQERAIGALQHPDAVSHYLPLSGYDAIILKLRLSGYLDGFALHPFDRRAITRVRDVKAVAFADRPTATVYLRVSRAESDHLTRILEDMLHDRTIDPAYRDTGASLARRLFCCAECHAEHEGQCGKPSAPDSPAASVVSHSPKESSHAP